MSDSVADVPVLPADGTLTLGDGTGTPVTLTIPYDNGNVKIEDFEADDQEAQAFESRGGTIYAIRDVKKKISTKITFTADFVGATDSAKANLLDFIRFTNKYSANVSTLAAANGKAKLISFKWAFERTNFGATADGSFTYKYCRAKASIEEGVPSKFSISLEAFHFSTDYLTVT